jgi:aspartate kinase
MQHTVEKIGGTSMSDYDSVRDNIILNSELGENIYSRMFVVSAYGGVTDELLEHKKTGEPGIYALFAGSTSDSAWRLAFDKLKQKLLAINTQLFGYGTLLDQANAFITLRLESALDVLNDLQSLCQHGHFTLQDHLSTVREMLASIGEVHSAYNMVQLLNRDGINATFVDLTAWNAPGHLSLDERIASALQGVDVHRSLPVVTGYAHSDTGLMGTFDRGYSEMTFSRLAVVSRAAEAIIHKEFHLSSADPKLVGEGNAVPIGRTNYDVADQLANIGMEAIHPKAAKGLRQFDIPLRVKNTFQPEHAGTLITKDYVSDSPCVEIVAGCKGVFALELFDQEMAGSVIEYDHAFASLVQRFKASVITKDMNANTLTYYVSANLKSIKRIASALTDQYADAEVSYRKVAIVSAFGSDMQVPGLLAKAVSALADNDISVLAMHQGMRQVDMQFVLDEADYEQAIKSLHSCLVEVLNHGEAIELAPYRMEAEVA